ncbi:hypothetical protein THF1A12_160018 [Vibrio jasicida]|uniref:DUF3265 domain-containing protein n=1 Tax=Vibrio jasicida TaxID=766224 RepID=A0AAU9QIW5_9VIBR|nr:hypothetical protein THF1A12_160018 [Vibrio jasicida]
MPNKAFESDSQRVAFFHAFTFFSTWFVEVVVLWRSHFNKTYGYSRAYICRFGF